MTPITEAQATVAHNGASCSAPAFSRVRDAAVSHPPAIVPAGAAERRGRIGRMGNTLLIGADILQQIAWEPKDREQLREAVGCSRTAVINWVRAYREVGMVYVCERRGRREILALSPRPYEMKDAK
jgi:hypothetical protein